MPFLHPPGGKNLALDTARESLDEFLLEDQVDDGNRDHRNDQHREDVVPLDVELTDVGKNDNWKGWVLGATQEY